MSVVSQHIKIRIQTENRNWQKLWRLATWFKNLRHRCKFHTKTCDCCEKL